MPRTTRPSPALAELIEQQDGLVTVDQLAQHGFGPDACYRRLHGRTWQRLLPGVILTVSGHPTRRQLLVAAHLYGGPESAIDAEDACDWYGVRPQGIDLTRVHIVTPWGSSARTRRFVVVRRATAEIRIGGQTIVRYVEPGTALVVAARNARDERAATAVLSSGLQRGLVTVTDLQEARSALGDKFCRSADRALTIVGVGLRSPGENDARTLLQSSLILPEPMWNVWLDLGDGGPPICVDALWLSAGLVHEVNGRRYHAWADQFEDMQARHDRLTAAGVIAMHNSPSRVRRDGAAALSEVERTYVRYEGRGLPAGVRLIPAPRFGG